jgi:hypothetical protein
MASHSENRLRGSVGIVFTSQNSVKERSSQNFPSKYLDA